MRRITTNQCAKGDNLNDCWRNTGTPVLAMLFFLVTVTVNAQAPWTKPEPGGGQFVGLPLYMEYNNDNSKRDTWHEIYWFESAADQNQETRFYKRSGKRHSSCTDASRVYPHSWEEICPCYDKRGLTGADGAGVGVVVNIAQVRYERKNNFCLNPSKHFGAPKELIIKVPVFLPPAPRLGEYYACPDGSGEITVDVLPDAVWGEKPSLVEWMRYDAATDQHTTLLLDDNNVFSNLQSTLQYNFGTNPLPLELIRVVAGRKIGNCTIYGDTLTIPVTTSIAPPLPNAPQPQVIFNCNAQPVTVTIPNPYGYDGVYWYRDPINPSGPTFAMHDGFTYNYLPAAGLDQLYVEYYRKLESGCRITSVRTPVYFVSQPNMQHYPLSLNGRIFDHRDYNESDCEVNAGIEKQAEHETRPYFYDLPNPNGLTVLEDLIEDFQTSYSDPCLSVSLTITEPRWVVIAGTDLSTAPYTVTQNNVGETVYRVCAENIASAQGDYGFKQYGLQVDVEASLTVCTPTGDQDAGSLDCQMLIKGLQATVQLREAAEITPLGCIFPPEDRIEDLVELNEDCDKREYETVCPDNDPVVLGPTEAEITEAFALNNISFGGEQVADFLKYRWEPATGLSDPQVANPTVTYSSLPVTNGQIQSYTCTVTYIGPGINGLPVNIQYTHCSYVYKCSVCGLDPGTPAGSDALGIGN